MLGNNEENPVALVAKLASAPLHHLLVLKLAYLA